MNSFYRRKEERRFGEKVRATEIAPPLFVLGHWRSGTTHLHHLARPGPRPVRLWLKSPPHTARIRMLLELFPDARCVFSHRDPYQVFQSCRHYFDTATWFTYLQRPDLPGIDDRIIRRDNGPHDAFFTQKDLIPKAQYHELGFQELESDPIRAMEKLYAGLALEGFDSFKPTLRRYAESLTGYRKNAFPALDGPPRGKISHHWQRGFEAWNYPT
jgi:hypothetical protein